jgi:anti-sigma-K factor RskA
MTSSEEQEYARHLDEDECAVCRSEVRELQSAISLMAFTLPSASPSPSVKARLMEQAQRVSPAAPPAKAGFRPAKAGFRWMQWVTSAVAVASLAVAFVVIRTNNELRRTTEELNGRIAQLEVQLAGQRNELALLTRAGIRVVDLAGQGANRQASGRIFVDDQRKQWTVYVNNLPAVPAGETYQLWFVPTSGDPIPSDTFNTEPDGSARVEVSVPDSVASLKAAAVTPEPAGGSQKPTNPLALLGSL